MALARALALALAVVSTLCAGDFPDMPPHLANHASLPLPVQRQADPRFKLTAKQQAAWAAAEAQSGSDDDDHDSDDVDEERKGIANDDEEASGDGYQQEDGSESESEEPPVDALDMARGIGLSESSSEDEDDGQEAWAALEEAPDVWNVHDDLDEAPQSEATSRRCAVGAGATFGCGTASFFFPG